MARRILKSLSDSESWHRVLSDERQSGPKLATFDASDFFQSLESRVVFFSCPEHTLETGNLLKVSKTIGYLPRYPFQFVVDSVRLVRATAFECLEPGFDAACGRFRVDSKAFEPFQSENITSEKGKKVV